MTALLRLSPLLLLLLCSCATFRTAQNTPVGQQEGKRQNQVVEATQPLNGANLMGENGDFGASTPVPTIDTEKQKMLADMQAMNAQLEAQRKLLDDKAAEIAASQAKAAEANARTAKQDALTEAEKTKQQQEITAQMQLEKERLLALTQYAEAQARKSEADAKSLLAVAVTMLAVIGGILIMRIWRRYPAHVVHGVAEVTVHPESVTRPPVQISPTGISIRPLPVDPDTFARFLQYAMQGNPLGANSMSDTAKIVTRAERALIMPYMQGLGFLASDNGASVLSDDGIKWGASWMLEYAPAPTAHIGENIPPADHAHENHAMNQGGEVVAEPTYDNFSPANTNYESKGILPIDDKKDGE